MSGDASRLIVPSRKKEPYISASCPYVDCRTSIEYQLPTFETVQKVPTNVTTFSVTCVACGRNFDPPGAPKLLREVRAKGTHEKGDVATKRRIGTDEHPIDMSLFVKTTDCAATTCWVSRHQRRPPRSRRRIAN